MDLEGFTSSARLLGTSVKGHEIEIASGLADDPSRFDIIATSDVDLEDAYILHGGVAYGTKAKIGSSVKVLGKVARATPVNMDKMRTALADVQKRIDAAAVNMKPNLDCSGGSDSCVLTFQGTQSDLNIGSAENINFEHVRVLVVDVPADSTAVIRIPGKKFNFQDFRIKSAVPNDRLILDFPSKYKVSFENVDLPAIVIAPNSDVSIQDGSIEGAVLSKGFKADCGCGSCVKVTTPEKISACLP